MPSNKSKKGIKSRAKNIVSLDRPYLGASHDEIIGDDAAVEVKCPYAGRDLPISPGPKFTFF